MSVKNCFFTTTVLMAVALGPCLLPQSASAQLAPVVIPQDEAPHPNTWTEWWYFVGHLTGKDPFGNIHHYGFDETFIRSDALALEPVSAIYEGHFEITDLDRKTFNVNANAMALQPDVIPPGGGFNITLNGWHMDGYGGTNHLQGFLPDLSYTAALTLTQATPPALHGNQGIIPYGVFGTSAYFSYTNLQVSGVVYDHGIPVQVNGIAWHDHQYGDFASTPGGWDWFSLQLSNGTQYMMYFLIDGNGSLVQKVGTLVNPDGSTVNLDPNSMVEAKLATWTSPTTGATYHTSWQIQLPGVQLDVVGLIPASEVTSSQAGSNYWEGDSNVTGTVNGQAVTGVAYVEQLPPKQLPTRGSVWVTIFQSLLGTL
jgi:predicted secreted hydrolase